MANKNLLRKRRAEMGAQNRWEKHDGRRASAAKAREARLTKKERDNGDDVTRPPHDADDVPSTPAPALNIVEEPPATPALEPMDFNENIPPPLTPAAMLNSMPSTPAIAALMTIDDEPFLTTPSTSFRLDDVSMLDELRHKNRIMEQQLRKQTLANKLLRDHLRTQRQRSTSLERSTSASQQRRVLANISNTPTGPNTQTRKLQVEKDLLFTLESGITFRAREALKRNFAGQNMDVWASTRAVKRLKKELAEGSSFAWTGEGERRALICTNIRAMLEGRLQALADSGRFRRPSQFVSQIVLVLTGDKSGDGLAATTKIGLIIGNVDQPNSPKNLSLLAIYFGHDDRKNLQARLCTVFEQVNELKMVSFVYEGRRWTVPTQLLLCADLKFTSALLGHQGAASTFPCPLCTARRGNLQDRIIGPRPSPPPSIDSYIAPPLVAIHLNDVVPPSFHLLHGNGQRLIDAICAEADDYDCGEEVRKRLKEAGVRRHPRTKQFTGPLKTTLFTAMRALRVIYSLSRANVLLVADLNDLELWTPTFYVQWLQLRSLDAARYPVRPKLHLLSAHVVPFARSHLWWGLISEQGIEHVHRMCNNLAGRYAHLGDPEKVVEKLAKHLTLLNALHDRGVEKNGEE
uniref:CxC1 domain-containing protein n=1 Tax=Globodera pallida TaxID=36090 RepID=A0A183C151_GLOPA